MWQDLCGVVVNGNVWELDIGRLDGKAGVKYLYCVCNDLGCVGLYSVLGMIAYISLIRCVGPLRLLCTANSGDKYHSICQRAISVCICTRKCHAIMYVRYCHDNSSLS